MPRSRLSPAGDGLDHPGQHGGPDTAQGLPRNRLPDGPQEVACPRESPGRFTPDSGAISMSTILDDLAVYARRTELEGRQAAELAKQKRTASSTVAEKIHGAGE